MYTVVFEAEASGGIKAGGLPTLPFPFSLPSPFHSIQFSDKPVGGKVRSSEGEVPRLPPYEYHPDY